MKVIDDIGNATNICNHINKEQVYQCYAFETRCYFPIEATFDHDAYWIMLTPQSFQISVANFYSF
jgi:hypothetical protein